MNDNSTRTPAPCYDPYNTQAPGSSGARGQGGAGGSQTARLMLQEAIDKVRKARQDIAKVQSDTEELRGSVKKIEGDIKAVAAELKVMQDKTFAIKGSEFQAGLNQEAARWFCMGLQRDLPQRKMTEMIVKVLANDAKNKHRFEVAKSFLKTRMTDFRCEERRRILGQKPYERFKTMSCADFSENFMSSIKAPARAYTTYTGNVAVLRKYCKEKSDSSSNTYQGFRTWLKEKYRTGSPTAEEIQELVTELDEDIEPTVPVPDEVVKVNPSSPLSPLDALDVAL